MFDQSVNVAMWYSKLSLSKKQFLSLFFAMRKKSFECHFEQMKNKCVKSCVFCAFFFQAKLWSRKHFCQGLEQINCWADLGRASLYTKRNKRQHRRLDTVFLKRRITYFLRDLLLVWRCLCSETRHSGPFWQFVELLCDEIDTGWCS